MRKLGASFEPDPCYGGCIFDTFGDEASMWWNVFCQSVERWTDQKTKKANYNIKWDALAFVLEAYEIDKPEGLQMMNYIMKIIGKTGFMSDEEVLGLVPVKPEDEQ